MGEGGRERGERGEGGYRRQNWGVKANYILFHRGYSLFQLFTWAGHSFAQRISCLHDAICYFQYSAPREIVQIGQCQRDS